MKYELKIALPMYKIIYSMLFMVIIILVRPIMSYNEIVSVLESSVALLAGVFMADIYYMEYMKERARQILTMDVLLQLWLGISIFLRRII